VPHRLDRSNPNIVWIGTGEANIFRSSQAGIGACKSADGGKTWTDISAGAAPRKWVSRLVASAFTLGTVYRTQRRMARRHGRC
jgi:hypothetical protein